MPKLEPMPLKLPELNGPEQKDNPQLDTSRQYSTLKDIFIDNARAWSFCLNEDFINAFKEGFLNNTKKIMNLGYIYTHNSTKKNDSITPSTNISKKKKN